MSKYTLKVKAVLSMKGNEGVHLKSASWAALTALPALAGGTGLGLAWRMPSACALLAPAAGLLLLTALLGVVWLYRVREVRRLFAVWNAYAEQELARAERRPATSARKRRFSRNPV